MLKSKNTYSVICVFMAVLMIVLSVVSPVGALSETLTTEEVTLKPSVNPEDKIDSALKEKMAEASPDEKIPVAIWYEDIDQEQVDTLTTQKVGFSQEEVALDYEMPSTALLNDLKAEKDGADAELEAYMERTKLQRESERKRTNDYIMTRREFSRAKYNEKSANIVKDLSLNESDITFNSQYAPMIITELFAEDIIKIKDYDSICSVVLHEEQKFVEVSMGSVKEASGVLKIENETSLSLTGKNIKVGIIEENRPRLTTDEDPGSIVPDNETPTIKMVNNKQIEDYGNFVVIDNMPYVNNSRHSSVVADLILNAAPDIKLYCSKFYLSNIEVMIAEGVTLINVSMGSAVSESAGNYAYTSDEKWFDHIISVHGVTVVNAAGNNGNETHDYTYVDSNGVTKKVYGPRVCCPAMANNVITVGGYFDCIDSNNNCVTNTYNSGSSYKNSIIYNGIELNGCEKPDVVVPQYKDIYNGGVSTGTSYAAPVLTGMIALMMDLKPSLASQPEAIKAIVLASCHDKSTQIVGTQELIEQGITERQGAGEADAWIMAAIISQGTYGVGRISATATQGVRRFMLPSANIPNGTSYLNVSITWIKENEVKNGNSHDSTANVSLGDDVNLDLYVYRNNQLAGFSKIGSVDVNDNRVSSTEMAYMQLNHSEWNYEIRIQKEEPYNDVVRYGYAYSTDKPYISYESGEDGIYYIRNYVTDKYLTLNSNNEAVMENFTGASNQQWVVSGEPGDYEILPAYGEIGKKINYGAQVGSNPYYKAVLGTSDLNMSITSWETDTTLEPDAHIFTSSGANGNNILSYTSSTGIFVRSTTEPVVNMYRMWVLEDINFRMGDVDCDGQLTVNDATFIQEYAGSTRSFNNLSYYLADYNGDGRVNVNDATAIQKYLAGIVQ